MDGWILIHKKILDWEWYADRNTTSLFFHLLLLASHKRGRWQGLEVVPGQVITSYRHLADDLNIGVQSVRTSLTRLKSTHEVTIKNTNKYSIITILKWADYQRPTRKPTNNQHTANKQLTTSKEVKEVKEVIPSDSKESQELLKYYLEAFKNKIHATQQPLINFPQFYKNSKPIIKKLGLERTKALLDVYLSSDDPFYRSNAWSITCFLSIKIINKLNLQTK